MSRLSLGRWVATVAPAEAVGFLFPISALAVSSAAPPLISWAFVALTGAVEGGVLGFAQWLRWREVLPRLEGPRYVGATAAAAVVAWAIGMAPSSLAELGWWPSSPGALTWLLVGLGGLVLLLAIPVAQARALRGHLDSPRAWIGWTVLAWILALPWSLAPSPFVDTSTPAWITGVAFALAGVVMALTMAVVTGAGARRLAH